MDWFSQLCVAVFIAFVIAFRAHRKKSLSNSGAIAGFFVMALHIFVGYRFGAVLLAFFFSSSTLTKFGEDKKRTLDPEFKEGGQRNWIQVLANSGIASVLVIAIWVLTEGQDKCLNSKDSPLITTLIGAVIGHYSCCNGDTWSSELGILSEDKPRLITTFKHVKKGTNGGVTKIGILAAAAAGSFIGLSFVLLSFSTTRCESSTVFKQLLVLPIATFARLCGSLFDSLLGATLQTKWILFCSSQVEYHSHIPIKDKNLAKVTGYDSNNRRFGERNSESNTMSVNQDLKTKLSLDEDLVSSPKEALSRASADRVAMRNKHLRSGISQSYTNQRDKNLAKVTGYDSNNRRFGERNSESSTMSVNQGAINQLSDQISALNDRMDEFTNRIEELNSKLNTKRNSPSQQNMSLQTETCNGSAPTSYFITSLGNGSLTGSKMANSSSSSQLNKDSPVMEEISSIARSQRQIMHQLDNLNNLLRGSSGEKSQQTRTNRRSIDRTADSMGTSVMAVVAVGCLGIFLMKGLLNRN